VNGLTDGKEPGVHSGDSDGGGTFVPGGSGGGRKGALWGLAIVAVVIIVIVLIAVGCDQLWRLGGRLLFPYANRK